MYYQRIQPLFRPTILFTVLITLLLYTILTFCYGMQRLQQKKRPHFEMKCSRRKVAVLMFIVFVNSGLPVQSFNVTL
jgi:hypothetical protein